MKTHTQSRGAHCTLHRNYRSPTSCTVLLIWSPMQPDWLDITSLDTGEHWPDGRGQGWVQMGQTLGCPHQTEGPLPVWTRGSQPSKQRGPAGEGGSGLSNVSEEAVIRVHPSSGMGTRSHSLTRHKAGCVCARGVGVQGRGF